MNNMTQVAAQLFNLENEIAKLKEELANARSTIEAWNHADILKCGCKYNKVWGGTKWEHWLVPCKEHGEWKERAQKAEQRLRNFGPSEDCDHKTMICIKCLVFEQEK